MRKRAGRIQKVLAVVQHQQRRAMAQGVDHLVLRAALSRQRHAQRLRHGRRQQRRVGHRCEFNHPHTVLELAANRMRGGQCQPRLADAGGADDADQAVPANRRQQ